MGLQLDIGLAIEFVRVTDVLRVALRERDVGRICESLPDFREAFELLPSDKQAKNVLLYSRILDLSAKTLRDADPNLACNGDFYVFYHAGALAAPEVIDAVRQGFTPFNLDEVELPEEFKVSSLAERENKALFGEYLGIISISPRSQLVGCFTYTIPRKFSYAWALESGYAEIFLPEVTFEGIGAIEFDADYLYAVELKCPNDRSGRYFRWIPRADAKNHPTREGPFKGSFVVSRDVFCGLQSYLRSVVKDLLSNGGISEIPIQDSRFGAGKTANRAESQRELDRLRHTIGNVLERAVAYYLAERFSPRAILRIGDEIELKRQQSPLVVASRTHSLKNTIILTCVDSGYAEVASEWVRHMAALDISNYLVICLDRSVHSMLSDRGVNVVLLPYDGGFGGMMAFRTRCILEVLKSGLNVIHSDADAFWKRDPLEEWFLSSNEDILASQGTIWPPEAIKEWGFVLCSGLCFYRSSIAAISLMQTCHSMILKYGSDQKAFNLALLAEGIRWEPTSPDYYLQYNSTEFACFARKLIGSSDRLSVGLLPHRNFQRLKEPKKLPYIAHLISKKGEAGEKLKVDHRRWEVEQIGLTHHQRGSSLVWLASYPRSGNTMLRVALKDVFSLPSRSVYNDVFDIGADPDTASRVGHVDEDWSALPAPVTDMVSADFSAFDFLRAKPDPVPLKTHATWSPGISTDKAICIVRDGRAAIASHSAYKQNFSGDKRSRTTLIEELILAPDRFCHSWAENVRSWLSHPEDLRLDVQFEEFIKDPDQYLNKVGEFIGKKRSESQIAQFSELKKVNHEFFRKGHSDSWRDEFNDSLHLLFWLISYKEMFQLGYSDAPQQLHWIVPRSAIPGSFSRHSFESESTSEIGDVEDFALWLGDCVSRHSKMIRARSSRFLLVRLYMALEYLIVFLESRGALRGVPSLRKLRGFIDAIFVSKGWLMPVLYVVCPTYNAKRFIDSTFMSIASQEGECYVRFHIQDGESTDGTFGLVDRWREALNTGSVPNLCEGILVTSAQEADNGMYDALNKGARHIGIPDSAVMTWINADDCLLPGAFSTMVETLSQHREVDWVIPAKRTFGEIGELRGCGAPQFSQQQIASGECDGVRIPVIQQEGVYWRSSLWNEVSGVDSNFRLAGDWDLWRRFGAISEPRYLQHPLAMFRKRKYQLGSSKALYLSEIEAIREGAIKTPGSNVKPWAKDRVLVFDVDRSCSSSTKYAVKIRAPYRV